MIQKIKSILLKDSYQKIGIYTITASLCKAISFAALPFFVNTLSEGDIGILNIFSSSIVFLTPIVSMGVLYSISIDYFKVSKEKYAQNFSTGLVIPVALTLLLFPVLYLLRTPLEKAFHFQHSFFWLIPLCIFFNFCFEAFIIILRNQNNTRSFTIVSFTKIIIEIALSIFFIVYLYTSWYSRALAFLIAGLIIAGWFFYHSKKQGFLVASVKYKGFQSELMFGLSGLVLQTAIFFITSSDKFFMMSFFGKEQAGFYSVASTFATIQYIACASMLQYLQPVLFKEFAAHRKWETLTSFYYKYLGAMLLTFFGVSIFGLLVYNFVLKATYKIYINYFFILSISSLIWTASNIFLQFIVFKKNKKVIFLLAVFCIVVSLSVNYIISKYFDANWLSFGQILTNLLVLLAVLFFSKKLKFFH